MRTQRRATSIRTFAALFLLLSLTIDPCIVNPSKSLTVPVRAKTTFTPNPAKKDRTCTSCSPRGNQEIYIPLIDLPESQKGELVFNSRSPQTMSATPVFYRRNGQAVVADAVQINSAEIRYVDIKNLLPQRYQHENDWGGFALTYYGTNREMWSQFRFMGVNGGGNVDEFFTVKDESRSALYDGTWWMPDKSEVIVALGNISEAPTSATITFGNGHTRHLELQARASEIVREQYPSGGAESVHISVNGPVGSIVPAGVITDKRGSFNSVIRFYDPTKAKQPNLYANGFRVKGTTPHLVLKNTTSGSIAVLPKIIPLAGNGGTLTLSQVSLAANETREVDLSELTDSARLRNDLGVVSLEITNWAAPGSIIGSLYDIDSRTGAAYDVPLRDSGPIRSMTGAYPWRIDADYKSVEYVTNITEDPVEFVVEFVYDGGKYTLGPRKLQPRETAVFDPEQIRDDRVKDVMGNVLPTNVARGQFKWAQRGATNGKILLIGRTEMTSLHDNISSSYSCPMDCGPSYEATVEFPDQVFVNEEVSGLVTETASWNYGYTMGPYPASASWSVDSSIVSFDPSPASDTTITGTSSGSGTVTAFVGSWERYDWDGLDCVDVGPQSEGDDGPMDVPRPEVELTTAKIHTLSAAFVGADGIAVATLNVGASAFDEEICGSDPQPFELTVNFTLPPGGELVASRCRAQALTTPSAAFNVGNATCTIDSGLAGHLTVTARRRCCMGPDVGINVTIGANKSGQTGTIDTRGTVIPKCNQ